MKLHVLFLAAVTLGACREPQTPPETPPVLARAAPVSGAGLNVELNSEARELPPADAAE